MANNREQEFLNGQTAAEKDYSAGRTELRIFPSYRTGAFIEGYSSFFKSKVERA